MMGCFGFLKFMMFVFNGIIFLGGGAILGVGIWVKVDSGSILNFLGSIKNAPPELSQLLNVGYLLIVVGSVLVIIGFLGCCGAATENRCMLLLFFVIVLVIFIAEVAGAVVILVFRPFTNNLIDKAGKAFVANIKEGYGNNSDVTGFWNTTMASLQCCGFYNMSDFTNSPFYFINSGYPIQCCGNSICSKAEAERQNVTGCFSKFESLINHNSIAIVGVSLAIAALELCAMVVSMFLYNKIKSERG